ncbi:hypothetical protein ACIBF5_10715 [Micromonospora sp. NPDC050417]|uniref:hypothetical protein n=1 Tax=Micromonospora sp. NPDC050417 TaxID=3364280 RepID=UPI003797C531
MTELWNWKIDDRMTVAEVSTALADVLGLAVVSMGAADPARLPLDAVVCDVWLRPGDFPTSVDCYGIPDGVSEVAAIAAFARRLGRPCLFVDDTLDPGRHLLVGSDGTIRPVHLDVREDDDGDVLSNLRLCSTHSPRCRAWSQCHQSQWAPDSVVPALAAA